MQSIPASPALADGQTVWIAYHFYKRCFSIRDADSRRVIGYADRMVVRNVRFLVAQSGRARVIRERRKNVHAYVQGDFANELQFLSRFAGDLREAYYNPYAISTFVDKATAEPLHLADLAVCENGKVYYRSCAGSAAFAIE